MTAVRSTKVSMLVAVALKGSVLASLFLLPACGWLGGEDGMFRDRQNDYLKEGVLPALDVPEEYANKEDEELYVIPPVTNRDVPSEEFTIPRPNPLGTAAGDGAVRIQKLKDDRWALIDSPPSHLWQRIKNFLTENKIPIVNENPNQGLMETTWLKQVGEEATTKKERYRFRIDQGVQRNSSEVHVTHFAVPLSSPAEVVDWPAQSIDSEREAWMLQELAEYLASNEFASVSLLAQGISTASKVSMLRDDGGQPLMVLDLPYDRAWASMGQALKKSNFKITDLNRSTGLYYVELLPPEDADKPGFFGRLFGKGKKASEEDKNFIFTLERADSSGVNIQVRDANNAEMGKDKTLPLLEQVKGNLS